MSAPLMLEVDGVSNSFTIPSVRRDTVREHVLAAFMPRRHWLNGHLVLARRIDSPRFLRVDTFSPRNVLHAFRLTSPSEVDEQFTAWLAEAYQVGAQQHLRRPP